MPDIVYGEGHFGNHAYEKARFVFCRDCRVALRAPRNDLRGASRSSQRYIEFMFNAVCPLPL
ncbi:MAG: hypothetical protein LBL66_08860 [Clostridiales bacterium]|nr:hypothetical protein [Clostridiales bacterium]